MQNKYENGDGAPVVSPMPKSDQEMWRVKGSIFSSQECHTFFGLIPPFIEGKDDPISMESR